MVSEFASGVRLLLRGFGMWRTHPGLMALGLVPAVIAALILAAALVPFGFALGPITGWLTPFADEWDSVWRMLLRAAIGIVLFVAAAALAAAVFTALALTIGDPFYQRIWAAVEEQHGGVPTGRGSSVVAAAREGLRLVLFGGLNAVIVVAIGLVPVVGGAIGAVVGVLLSGRLLARELTGRSFDARGIDRGARSKTLAASRARVLGFGVATQLCFLVPLGALVTMPAAVAGATMLARGLIDARAVHTGGVDAAHDRTDGVSAASDPAAGSAPASDPASGHASGDHA